MWSFDVNIHQGTFSTSNTVSDVRRYVKRIRKAGYLRTEIGIRPKLWSLDQAFVGHTRTWDAFGNGHMSKGELLEKLKGQGKVFYKTRSECLRARQKFVASVRQVIEEVYGQ